MIGGVKLISLGGSWYFLIAGLALLASAVQLARQRVSGAVIYGATFLGTIVWSLWEVGFQFWPLVSRLLAMGVTGARVGEVRTARFEQFNLDYARCRPACPAWRWAQLCTWMKCDVVRQLVDGYSTLASG